MGAARRDGKDARVFAVLLRPPRRRAPASGEKVGGVRPENKKNTKQRARGHTLVRLVTALPSTRTRPLHPIFSVLLIYFDV